MTQAPDQETWRALVAFTTADRPAYVRRGLPALAGACLVDARLDLVVALDGDDGETRAFCAEWDVPIVYSDVREGVGLSKNRVLESFPDYDFYFFVEDDVEVLDGTLFPRHVELMRASGLHHMSLFASARGRERLGETVVCGERIVHYRFGDAALNAFTREGLELVGGWHPLFAQYRRWGHTEQSNRFVLRGLAPAPFNVASGLVKTCVWNIPPSVTAWAGLAAVGDDGLAEPERALMSQGLTHVPLRTLAPYHAGELPPGQLHRLSGALAGRGRYPFLSGAERRRALSDLQLWRFETSSSRVRRYIALLLAGVLTPRSMELRHAVKTKLLQARRGLRRPSHAPPDG